MGWGATLWSRRNTATTDKYVYRSSDEEGLHQCDKGKYRHLLLVKVLQGNPIKTSEVWKGEASGRCRAS